jgi:hypothetical protein
MLNFGASRKIFSVWVCTLNFSIGRKNLRVQVCVRNLGTARKNVGLQDHVINLALHGVHTNKMVCVVCALLTECGKSIGCRMTS